MFLSRDEMLFSKMRTVITYTDDLVKPQIVNILYRMGKPLAKCCSSLFFFRI